MNAAKMTLVSTVVAAALGLALGLSAVPSDSYACHKETEHGNQTNCGGGGPIQFTAQLTAGAFVFGPVDVTPNSRENVLRSEDNVDLDIDDSPEPDTWNQVFNTCGELLEPNSVESFFVGEDNWTIEKAGGVRVILRDIVLQDAKVTVQLIGDEFDFIDPDKAFLPLPGDTSEFTLEQFIILGSTLKGIHPRMGCQPPGGGGADINDLLPDPEGFSTLTITAVES